MTEQELKKLQDAIERAKLSVKKNRAALKDAPKSKIKLRKRYLREALLRLEKAKLAYAEAKKEAKKEAKEAKPKFSETVSKKVNTVKEGVSKINLKKVFGYTGLAIVTVATGIGAYVFFGNGATDAEEAVETDSM
jgi:hypothetical protein